MTNVVQQMGAPVAHFYGSAKKVEAERKLLQQVIMIAERILGCSFPSMDSIYTHTQEESTEHPQR